MLLSIVLVAVFSADMIYSHKVPDIGEGITDYDAYKNTSCLEIRADADGQLRLYSAEFMRS